MKKIKTLFVREFENHVIKKTLPIVEPGLEWALNPDVSEASVKIDGTCCMIKDNKIYARYDFKQDGKRILPEGAIPCQEEADPTTGHFPHWVLVTDQPQYKYHKIAFDKQKPLEDGTYELCGIHFQSNPYDLKEDVLEKHGVRIIDDLPVRTYDTIQDWLFKHYEEGIVFRNKVTNEMCKIKRTDFGFEWKTCKKKN